MKNTLILFLLAIGPVVFAQQDWDKLLAKYNKGSVPYITAQEAAVMMSTDEKVIFLDAREVAEFETSHLPQAVFVGYDDLDADELPRQTLEQADKIIVYCTVGVRSEDIGEILLKKGFQNVYNLKGGILSWKNADFVVYNRNGQPTGKVHVYGPNWGRWLTRGIPVYD